MAERRYETLLLVRPDQGENGLKDVLARVTSLVTDQGGTVSQEHIWGLRDLSYEINKEKRAYYALLEFRSTPVALAEVERNLKLMEPVLRFLSVRQDENAPPARLRIDDAPADEGRRYDDDESGRGARDLDADDTVLSEGDA
jgi:small subunit ribosomal protein S6